MYSHFIEVLDLQKMDKSSLQPQHMGYSRYCFLKLRGLPSTGADNGVNGARSTAVLPLGTAVAPGTGAVDPVDKPLGSGILTGNGPTAQLPVDFPISLLLRSLNIFCSRAHR